MKIIFYLFALILGTVFSLITIFINIIIEELKSITVSSFIKI